MASTVLVTFPKHLVLQKHSVHFINIPMVMSNLCMCHKHANRTPTSVKVLAYGKYCRMRFKYPPWTSQGNNICIMEFCYNPEKGGQVNQKQSASPCTHILVTFILIWEKKTSSHLEIISFIYKQKKE